MAMSHRPGHAVEVSIDEAKEGYIERQHGVTLR